MTLSFANQNLNTISRADAISETGEAGNSNSQNRLGGENAGLVFATQNGFNNGAELRYISDIAASSAGDATVIAVPGIDVEAVEAALQITSPFANNGVGDDFGDDISSAVTLATDGIAITGEFEAAGDRDFFAVEVVAGQTYQFQVFTNSSGIAGVTLNDSTLTLRDATGAEIGFDDDSGVGAGSVLIFTAETSGTVFLDIGEFGDNNTGVYQVSAQNIVLPADPQVLTVDDAPLLSAIETIGDTDTFTVSLDAGVTYALNVLSSFDDQTGNALTLEASNLTLIGPGGRTIAFDFNDAPGNDASIGFTPTQAGIYTLVVGSGIPSSSSNVRGGTYEIAVSTVAAVPGATSGADVIDGTTGIDRLEGLDGDDTLNGGDGDDTLIGGFGVDTLNGGSGDDILDGGVDGFDPDGGTTGDDILNGGDGNDTLIYSLSDTNSNDVDTFNGGSGVDTFVVTNIVTNDLFNRLVDLNQDGFFLNSSFDGQTLQTRGVLNDIENVTVSGDIDIIGDAGDNVLIATAADGVNQIDGGGGDDFIQGGGGADNLIGGGGTDTLSYASDTAGVTVNIGNNTTSRGDAAGDTISGFENVVGGSGNDFLLGSSGNNVLEGGAGNDTFDGGLGGDVQLGGAGSDFFQINQSVIAGDLLDGGEGFDTIQNFFESVTANINLRTATLRSIERLDFAGNYGANNSISLSAEQASGVESVRVFNRDITLTDLAVNVFLEGADSLDLSNLAFQNFTGEDDVVNIIGAAGNETIIGSIVNDVINASGGDDTVIGGLGDDNINGGLGDDTITGGLGADILDGGDGIDTLSYAGATDDLVINIAGNIVFGGEADGDQISGFENVIGGSGDDLIIGTDDDNLLDGGQGADELRGGLGADTLDGGLGADELDGGDGIDTVSYANSFERVVVNLGSGAANNGDAQGDEFTSIENLIGSAFGDTLVGDGEVNILTGGAGDDTLNGGAGNDRLFGGADDDTLLGSSGNDFLSGEAGNDTLNGGIGADNLFGGSGDDTLIGSDGSDNLTGGAGIDDLVGGAGNDTLLGQAGTDLLSGGDGNDTLEGGLGRDILNGGDGQDTLNGGDAFDSLNGGAGNDLLDGGDGNDVLLGGAGSDDLVGGNGNDRLDGSQGNDLLDGGVGNDAYIGGAGADQFVLRAGFGRDRLFDFEDGQDQIIIDSSLATSFADLTIRQVGTATIIFANGDTSNFIRLFDTDADDIGTSDFVFTSFGVLEESPGNDIFDFANVEPLEEPATFEVEIFEADASSSDFRAELDLPDLLSDAQLFEFAENWYNDADFALL